MIRFRNPGTQYTTQIQVFKELYKEYKNVEYFTLDDMAQTIARCSLMTAYGYAGEQALSLSNTENDSLNSTKMNAKMYAEVFRLLGWITSYGSSSYPLVFTYIGEHVALTDEVLPLYEQCVLGINNPQEIMDVKYTENVRFFKATLLSLRELNGIMYKHELCYGPMSIDDLDKAQFDSMIKKILKLRGSYKRYTEEYNSLCESLNVKPTLPDNSTRLPIAFMKTCQWICSERSKDLYPPKSLECIKLTPKGLELSFVLEGMKDLRLDEFDKYEKETQSALIRLGVYSMLKRSGFNITPVQDQYDSDTKLCANILNGKELLFSPYQTLSRVKVDEALGIVRSKEGHNSEKTVYGSSKRNEAKQVLLTLKGKGHSTHLNDEEVENFVKRIKQLEQKGFSKEKIVTYFEDKTIKYTQTNFYPFVAMLFRVIGYKCHASRQGDNGARWDAIIEDATDSIPIEIKSPTEEMHISLKAIRQAIENKIVLLSRKTYSTNIETTTLAVGYKLPNERAEVINLINDFKSAYGISVGVFDLKTLLIIAIASVIDKNSVDDVEFKHLEGLADASFGKTK